MKTIDKETVIVAALIAALIAVMIIAALGATS